MAKYNTISRCIVETLVVLRNKRSKWDSQWLLSCKHRQIVWDWLQWLKTSKLGNKYANMLCLFWKYLNPIARISWIYLIKTPTFKCYLKYWGTLFAIFAKNLFHVHGLMRYWAGKWFGSEPSLEKWRDWTACGAVC